MTNLSEPPVLAHAVTRRSRRLSVIWIIPLVAVAIGAWLAWDTLSKEGPTIRVTFNTAEGLQPGQSQLKFKDIVFGTVKSLKLAPDNTHVVVTIATTHEAKPLLTDKTVFWVVKPRLFAGSVSGLETLLSGSYVGMLPGATAGKPQHKFTGREDPPILSEHVPGHIFLMKAKRLGSISLGSPIYYRDLSVGEVLGWDIADMADYVTIHAFVRAPYDSYVHDDTRFWNASGLSIKLAGAGVEVQLESLKALILGGIAFETPDLEGRAQSVSLENHVFPLFADRDTAQAASYTRKVQVVSYFPGSVSGLGVGSPVTMHGLVVGQVTNVRLAYDKATDTVLAPVRYEVEPERIVGVGVRMFQDRARGGRGAAEAGIARDLAKRQPDHRPAAGRARFRPRCAAGPALDGRRLFRLADDAGRRVRRAHGSGGRAPRQGQPDPVRSTRQKPRRHPEIGQRSRQRTTGAPGADPARGDDLVP